MAILREVQEAISSLFSPGQLTELRALLVDGNWVGFFFDDHDRLAAVISELDTMPDDIKGLYLVFNPIKRSVLQMPHSNLYLNPSDHEMYTAIAYPNRRMWPLTTNDDIEMIEWLMVDVDPVRASGFEHDCATSAERKAAAQIANDVVRFCEAKGCTAPLLASSGNGWHVLYRIRLENTMESRAVVAAFLRTLGLKFTNARVAKIDQAVKNAARLTRAYGSTTRKGTNTSERPWRNNRVQHKGSDTACSQHVIQSIASLIPALSATRNVSSYPELHDDFDPDDFLEWVEEVWPVADDFEKDGIRFIAIEECLNAERRHRGDWKKSAFIIGETLGYKCHSDDCAEFGIAAALSKLADLHGERYPGQIYGDEIADVSSDEVVMDDLEIEDIDVE